MDGNHDNVRRRVVEEDRLSSLPDELLHKILPCFDMKFAVQTCFLSSKWKLLWTLVPCLNFSTDHFDTLGKFCKFVTHVLSHRNHQIQVSSVKLDFHEAANQVVVSKIAKYAFSHNVQELTVISFFPTQHAYPPCLFSSQSLKHLTLPCSYVQHCNTPKTLLDFPYLTTLNLSYITLCGDLFSKCVNLKNLILKCFYVKGLEEEEVVDIITPRLSNLLLIHGRCSITINVIAPQLENLTITNCSIGYLNAPSGLSSLYYRTHLSFYGILQFSNDQFHSLNKGTIRLSMYPTYEAYKEEDAIKTINMLQNLHSARYLTLDADTVECLSSFPDLLSQHPSPFGNLNCLTIDYSTRKNAYKVTMSTEARNFLLQNSPNAKFVLELSKSQYILL